MSSADQEDWRATLEDEANGAYSEWPLGQRLHDLTAYANFGILLSARVGGDPADWEREIEALVTESASFVQRIPVAELLGEGRDHSLEKIAAKAKGRFALDQGRGIDPMHLALLGGVSESRMRSLISGKSPQIAREEGLVPAYLALEWLADHDRFLPSLWRQGPSSDDYPLLMPATQTIRKPVFVPKAADGTIFNPGCRTTKGFVIGPKNTPEYIDDFYEALECLQVMDPPRWRRPSATTGRPGLVTGTGEFVRKTREELDALAPAAAA